MVALRRTFWVLTAIYWIGIFTLTHLPGSAIQRIPHFWDKAEHFIAYFFLAGLLGCSLMLSFPRVRGIPVGVLLVGFTYGAIDEILQEFVVGRSADWRDWIADALGVWLAVFLLWALRKWLRYRGMMPAVLEG